MKFVFWQNVISIHQSAFIKALAREHEVTLIAAEELDVQRRNEKWSIPSMGNARIIIAPSDCVINRLIEQADTEHIFSGINAYPMVYKAFKIAVKRGLKVSVMAEPYEWAGFKGFLRRLMYAGLFLRFGRNIRHLFATGNMGVMCYRKAGFPSERIHQWGYFTEQPELNIFDSSNRLLPNIIFIGKIDERKNILSLVEVVKRHSDLFDRFYVIGIGTLEAELKESIKDKPKIKYVGAVPNSEVLDYLTNCDLLVLPSHFDGWGAVVNEALLSGVRVLCSDRCGASVLLDGMERGGTFNLKVEGDLENELVDWLSKGVLTTADRNKISQWAQNNISGLIAAKYFVATESGYNKSAPWITPPVK